MIAIIDVKEFHTKFGLPAPYYNTLLDEAARQRRYNLITEEAKELLEATDPVSQFDALIDLLYVVFGTGVEMGVDTVQIWSGWNRVHDSNMAKLGLDGKPILRADGKLLKPEGWQPPNLTGIFIPTSADAVTDQPSV